MYLRRRPTISRKEQMSGIVTPQSTMEYTSVAIPVDSGVTNLIHDRRSCVDFTLEVRQMWLDVPTQA